MQNINNLFRDYDIRGIVDKKVFNNDFAYKLGVALKVLILKKKLSKNIIIGFDGRASSIEFKNHLAHGLGETIKIVVIGMVPSPVVYFAVHHLKISNAVMITGSHNPINYNGFKIIIDNISILTATIQDIKKIFLQQKVTATPLPKIKEYTNIIDDYINFIKSKIKPTPQKYKIVVDAGNGVGGIVAPKLYRSLGFEVIELFCKVDSNFPNHHPDPSVPENLDDLVDSVIKNQAICGIALDGDADRISLVTNKGEKVFSDRLLALFVPFVLKDNPKATIIFDVKCTSVVADVIKKAGGIAVMNKTGHSLQKQKMLELNAPLAGEFSGHIFFKDRWLGFDDGIYTGARFLEILINHLDTKDSSMLFQYFAPSRPNTPEIQLKVKEYNKKEIINNIIKKSSWKGMQNIITIDGIRVEYQKCWGLLRASNTMPVLTLRFEAEDETSLKYIIKKFISQIKNIYPDTIDLTPLEKLI